MIKTKIITILSTLLIANVVSAESKSLEVSLFTETPVGSLASFEIYSNTTSFFTGRFSQSFNFTKTINNRNGVTMNTNRFDLSGNTNYNINFQINQDSTTITSPNWNFDWNFR